MNFKIIILSALSVLMANVARAQFRIPTFDVELKANQHISPGRGNIEDKLRHFETTNIHGALHIHFGQRLALGVFYSKSFRGEAVYTYGEGSAPDVRRDLLMAIRGIDLRLSAGRARRWRPYISGTVSRIELVQDNVVYRVAGKSAMYGVNIGVMRRLSNNLYLNLIEIGGKYINDKMFWFDDNGSGGALMVDAKMGLTYNFGKRK
jgi:hypothetical protein